MKMLLSILAGRVGHVFGLTNDTAVAPDTPSAEQIERARTALCQLKEFGRLLRQKGVTAELAQHWIREGRM